jgi:hypothetical protein
MKISIRIATLLTVAFSVAAVAHAQSQVQVSTGYNDEPRTGAGFSGVPFGADSGQPDPWYGSTNTTFYGDSGVAQAYDPDEDAILLQNLGSGPIDLTAASMGIYNLFTLDSISGPVELDPGSYVILAGVDGSDIFSGLQTVDLTIGGIDYSYSDVATADAPNGVLDGANPWIGGAESEPWTAIYTPPAAGAPDASSTLLLCGISLSGLAGLHRRFKKHQTLLV